MYSAHLSRIFFPFSKMLLLFFHFRNPVDEQVFFPEISSIFLYIVCSIRLRNSLMFLNLSLIHFSLASSHFCDFLMQCFVFFSIILLASFPYGPKYPQSSIFLFCFPFNFWYFSSAASVIYFEICPLLVHFLSFS